MATFVAALHVPAPADAPVNEFRGVALQQRAAAVEQRVAAMGAGVDAARVLAVMERPEPGAPVFHAVTPQPARWPSQRHATSQPLSTNRQPS